jgi:hypothetical protein
MAVAPVKGTITRQSRLSNEVLIFSWNLSKLQITLSLVYGISRRSCPDLKKNFEWSRNKKLTLRSKQNNLSEQHELKDYLFIVTRAFKFYKIGNFKKKSEFNPWYYRVQITPKFEREISSVICNFTCEISMLPWKRSLFLVPRWFPGFFQSFIFVLNNIKR